MAPSGGDAGAALEGAVLRANPAYELAPFEALQASELELLKHVREDPDMFGLLRPRGAGLRFKAVSKDTADLFQAMQAPGRLPESIDDREAVVGLVLDGVLEIEIDGEFRSGPRAISTLRSQASAADSAPRAKGRLAQLAHDALRYAQALEGVSPRELSARLYFYNRIPLTPAWKRLIPDRAAASAYLGLDSGGTAALLRRDWKALPEKDTERWFCWTPRRDPPARASALLYKLYVSPAADVAARAVRALVETIPPAEARMWKCGASALDLLRPDKIVVYFETLPPLQRAAEALAQALGGCPAHGVPFTAGIGGDGLLSWGVDPPRDQQLGLGEERESWRLWLTNQLAAALLDARAAPDAAMEPWRYALQRVALKGVDTDSWSPRRSIWGGELWANPTLS